MKTIKKFFQNEVLSYLFFGVATTLIFFVIKMITYKMTNSGLWSDIIANTVAIVFAFVTNKLWVFNTKESSKSIWSEFVQFVSSRLVLMGLSALANWYFVDKNPQIITNSFGVNKDTAVAILTIVIQFLTIVINYLVSKFFVFRNKK